MLREPQTSDIIYCILCICFLVVVVYIFLPFKIRGIFTYTPDYHIFRFTTNHKPPAKSTPCEWDMQEHGRWSWSNWRPPSYPLRALVQSLQSEPPGAGPVVEAGRDPHPEFFVLTNTKTDGPKGIHFKYDWVASLFFGKKHRGNLQGRRKYVLPNLVFFVQLAKDVYPIRAVAGPNSWVKAWWSNEI